MSGNVRQTNPLAVVSLVAGVLGWSILPIVGSLIAIVTGHIARKEIRQNLAFDGDVMAMIGLVLGWSVVAMTIMGIMVFLLLFGGMAWLDTH